ncbi:hypothetical protein BG015_003904 [Linnemannia schmuckeri]|uniref:Tcp11-domain-containing protein n=1 Tax=Linnemannia schmuckeri TaxID=64567 RepID=A0A9P5S5L0_9FUNG|nr:hypothetical protein BG015_003904 [Linnemannia schmuckeri]
MSPSDISSLSSSSIAPSSPGTTSASATPSPSPTSGPTCISTSSLPPSVHPHSLSSSSKEETLAAATQPSDSSRSPFPTVPDTLSDTSPSTTPYSASSPSPPPSSPDQNEASSQPARTGIFLPNFLSSIRIFNSRPPTSIHPSQSPSKAEVQHLPPSSSPSATISSSATRSSSNGKSSSNSSRSRQKDTTRAHSVIVTDVRSINIRDISTVPTLTSFNQKRSKRRSSSASHHSPVPSSSCTSASSSSSIQFTSTSRRKRIKKSSHSSRAPWNLCTSSCGCTQPQSSSAAEPQVESLTDLKHQDLVPGISQSHMESTGRIRTISESEVSVSDRTQSSHRIVHQQQQQQHERRSRQSSLHQSGQDPTAELTSHSQSQEPSSQTVPSLHIQHRLPPPSPQQALHSLTHNHNQTQLRSALNNPLPQRIQTHQESDQQHTPHHKRQRSPQLQQMAFELPSPSTSSSASSAASGIKNTERLKRARHQSGEPYESVSDDTAQTESAHTMALQGKDSRDQNDHSNKQDSFNLPDTHKLSYPMPAPSHTVQHDRIVVLQVRQPSRIHPFDSESSGSNMAGKSQDDRHHPLDGPVLAPLPNPRTDVEPSIHPLESEARKDTKSQQGYPSDGRHLEASNRVQPAPESSSHKLPIAPQHQEVIQQRPSTGATVQRTGAVPPKVASSPSSAARSQQQQSSSHQPSRPSGANTAIPVAKPNPATLMLPITRDTLRELDLFEIFKNPQLRHDIVFDPHLQFRPNFDGERGLTKRREADRFWHEVGAELNARRAVLSARRDATTKMLNLAGLTASSPSSRMIQQQAQQMCPLPKAFLLPRLIDELREILLSLLPAAPSNQDGSKPSQQDAAHQENSERSLLTSTLDPELILQELDHGVLDVHALFRYLGDSLKGHCAPMRDTLVESMVHTVVDLEEIVRGIRMCFEILEWMKLDIANHQLRTLRPWLLDNSIDFEQKYFTEHLGRGGSLHRTTSWFKKSWLNWESVKQSVIGKVSPPNVATIPCSRRPSLASSPSTEQDGNPQGSSPAALSSAQAAINFKRRTSVVSTDIGENILDGVVNEGLLEMILRPHGSVNTMPETFELDHYRLLLFHNDFQDLTILCILLILFRQLAQNCWTQQDLVEIKKVVWLLLTDENANFGANTQTGKSGGGQHGSNASGGNSGMKDIVIQIEFAARKVRERSVNGTAAIAAAATAVTGSRRSSLSPETPIPTTVGLRRGSPASSVQTVSMATGSNLLHHPMKSTVTIPRPPSTAAMVSLAATSSKTGEVAAPTVPSLSASDTNLLTAWLDNALCRTSTLYKLIQKRLLIHFRRWLYLHSCSSMLVLSASCASLASAISMSSSQRLNGGEDQSKGDDDEEETTTTTVLSGGQLMGSSRQGNGATATPPTKKSNAEAEGGQPNTPIPAGVASPVLSPEEANKAAAEALAAKLSFNTAEMEAHGLTGLEDEMIALLEKIRAVSEFNKKVYGSWYRDLVKQGRAERWLETTTSPGSGSPAEDSDSSATSIGPKAAPSTTLSASTSNSNTSAKTMA